ncbi:secreted RxLR effector protein 161-like [Aegilops tauschii subsp. strangulata]|uniref:secreted RxLR effector protein 161-like n=1 Tax=Aegilops tauschii subsp. strangulata TaxID=200361 RepID=UPI003CC853B3
MTRPDLAYAVQQACLHMHDPRDCHLSIIKRILRYVRGTSTYGPLLQASPSTDIVAYSDEDWAGCPDTRRSTSGYCVYLGNTLIRWSTKRQATVSRSSVEAEYRAVANAVADCVWLRQLLERTKHIELDIHFVREKVALGEFRIVHVPTTQQLADIMTKGLPTSAFQSFLSGLCVLQGSDDSTAAGC